MPDTPKINRKDFLARVGGTIVGLGLGASCGSREQQGGETASEAASAAAAAEETAAVQPAYRTLGKAKIKVTEVGFGASRTMDPQLMNYAYESGITFFDTGRSYYNGQNEQLVGKVFSGKRREVVINSKVQPGSLEKMRRDLETSLGALKTDYIDCLLIHGASEPEHIDSEEVREFLSRAKEEGKIRAYGFSLHTNSLKLIDLAAESAFHEVIMVPYNFMGSYTHMLGGSSAEWDADALEKAIEKAGKAGIDFIAMKACSGGYMKDKDGQGSYRAALKWVLRNPYMKTTATAMGNFQQIEEDVRAMGAGGKLGLEERRMLDSYAALYGASFCRMCDTCAGQCPRGVAVSQVNRLHMYAASYGGDMAAGARESYSALGGSSAAACNGCEQCTVECPYGLPLGSKLRQAHSMLS